MAYARDLSSSRIDAWYCSVPDKSENWGGGLSSVGLGKTSYLPVIVFVLLLFDLIFSPPKNNMSTSKNSKKKTNSSKMNLLSACVGLFLSN